MTNSTSPQWSDMRLMVLLLVGFDLTLTFLRIGYSQRLTFAFARLTRRLHQEGWSGWLLFWMGGTSVLFLPNAPYLLTDLFHLQWAGQSAPIWLDTLLLVAYAATGLVLFYRTLFILLGIAAAYWRPFWVKMGAVGLVYLISFGIYLGRYLRFNSWDLLTDPMALFWAIGAHFWQPTAHPTAWGVTLGYGTLLLIGYIGLARWTHHSQRQYDTVTTTTIRLPEAPLSNSL